MKLVFLFLFIFYVSINGFDYKFKNQYFSKKDTTYKWKDYNINYINESNNKNQCEKKEALLFIHGFGASLFHWRHNIIGLSNDFDIYAIDLLGFGKSDKPYENYNIDLWKNLTCDFLDEIVKKNTTLIGNSMGGSIALQSCNHSLVKNIVLINPYIDVNKNIRSNLNKTNIWSKIKKWTYKKIIKGFSNIYFFFMKQKPQISNTLKTLYPEQPENVDEPLIESIMYPTEDPNAKKVLCIILKNVILTNNVDYRNSILHLQKPCLIIWGIKDEWLKSSIVENIMKLNEKINVIYVNAGHCPHDEIPEQVNEIIYKFMQ